MDSEIAPRIQYGALPYRVRARTVEVLLITSRERKRWIIPKGWPMKGRTPWATAGLEALQEAGIRGRIGKKPLGCYGYVKCGAAGARQPCAVTVFPLRVELEKDDWREARERSRQWFSLDEAKAVVEEPELRALISAFDPKARRRGAA